MDADEVKKAHDALESSISKVLWDFSDKYFKDVTKDDMYQAACIMQSVLSESLSNMEYQMGNMAPFTSHQRDHICCKLVIGTP